MSRESYSLDTLLVYLGSRPEKVTGAIVPPIFQTSTFAQAAPGDYGDFDYTRTDNPTRSALQECLAAAEGAKHALAYSSGMAAVDCILNLLQAGDHVVTGDDIYGGTYRYFTDVAARRGITFDFVKIADEASLRKAIRPNTSLIWFESPTNPMLGLVDIAMVARVAKEFGCLSAIDNTFASSYVQQPLALGVDLVMHSMTKYLNGHSDIVMGAIMLNDSSLYERLKYLQNAIGPTPSPFDCFLAQRGMKTLAVRMVRHCENAQRVAEFLEKHPKVLEVTYPGLKSHPQHELAKKQMAGFGGMIAFRVDGDNDAVKRFLKGTRIFSLAVSLGGVESLIEQPATMTHFEMPREAREAVGITDNLIRASIGIESADDLIEDLDEALCRI